MCGVASIWMDGFNMSAFQCWYRARGYTRTRGSIAALLGVVTSDSYFFPRDVRLRELSLRPQRSNE